MLDGAALVRALVLLARVAEHERAGRQRHPCLGDAVLEGAAAHVRDAHRLVPFCEGPVAPLCAAAMVHDAEPGNLEE